MPVLSEAEIDRVIRFNINAIGVNEEQKTAAVGLWPLMSFINDGFPIVECNSNKDMIFVQAIIGMKKGTILAMPFCDPSLPWEDQKKILEERHEVFLD